MNDWHGHKYTLLFFCILKVLPITSSPKCELNRNQDTGTPQNCELKR